MRTTWSMVLACAAVGLGSGCREERSPQVADRLPGEPVVEARTAGFVAGPPAPPPVMRNPLAGNEQALAEGRRLYVWYNCAGCHGMEGGGGMGPPFADDDWIYGSLPNNVYQSIVQGRPNGMPAFSRLSNDHIWKLVLRVREIGNLEDPAPGREDEAGEGGASTREREGEDGAREGQGGR